MPVRYEDILAVQLVEQDLPDQGGLLRAALATVREAGHPHGVLGVLVDQGVLTRRQGSAFFQQVQQRKRKRAAGVYTHLLVQAGVAAERLRPLQGRARGELSLDELGELVVAAELLTPEREQALRFQARLVLDRDLAERTRAELQRLLTQPAGPAPPEPARRPDFVSASGTVQPDEVQRIVKGTLSDADTELPGPRFRVPDWVDMGDRWTGRLLHGYRILGRIGQGAMGVVYLVDHQDQPERPVALKVLQRDASREAKGRFKREILANSFFSHPRVLDVYDAGETERGDHFLAMEFVDGDDLEDLLAQEPLGLKESLVLARDMFGALGAAHGAGVVHRDVKPQNILVDRRTGESKLMDFGIAIIRDLGEFETKVFHSMEGGVTGTPEYMSPEQASGEAILEASDLYSMGVVLYRLLSGRLPFESETAQGYITCHMIEDPLPLVKANPKCKSLPKELAPLLERLLHKDPGERPQQAEEVVGILEEAVQQVGERSGGFWSRFGFGR